MCRVAILILDKIDFKPKPGKRENKGHYIIIKRSIQQKDITFINIYTSNIGAPKYTREIMTDLKGEIDTNIKQ